MMTLILYDLDPLPQNGDSCAYE